MAQMSRQPPEEPVRMAAVSTEPAPQAPAVLDPAGVVREFNAQNPQHEALGTRILHMVDAARHLGEQASQAATTADSERLTHLTIAAEDPERRAPRWRQLLLAGGTLALDAVACYFAAQALGNGQAETLAWTALFLAVLGAGEFALDFYRDRHRRVWRYIAIGLGGFVTGLGILRFTYLVTVGAAGPIAALVGAALFTVATVLFVMAGYWALRRAETPEAGKARRRARRAAREARATAERAARCRAKRDRLIDAYLVRLKVGPLASCSASDLPAMEAAVRSHLLGEAA